MFDRPNTPVSVRAEDLPLIEAIDDARKRYRFSDAAAQQLIDHFTKPQLALKSWIFELCDPTPRTDPFMTNDDLAGFTRAVLTCGEDCSARWADLTRTVRRLARRIKHFAQDKRRVWMRAGRPENVDRSLIFYVIRLIEEATGVAFRLSHPAPLLGSPGGPMLRLAEAALLRLFRIDDRTVGCLGLVSPARHYKREEIARVAKLARRASRTSPASPANWPSDVILAFRSDVRVELAGKARQENTDQGKGRQENKDQGAASPGSWGIASSWGIPREVLEAAVVAGRQTRLNYGSGLNDLQDNLKSGAQPDLIELSKRKSPRI